MRKVEVMRPKGKKNKAKKVKRRIEVRERLNLSLGTSRPRDEWTNGVTVKRDGAENWRHRRVLKKE